MRVTPSDAQEIFVGLRQASDMLAGEHYSVLEFAPPADSACVCRNRGLRMRIILGVLVLLGLVGAAQSREWAGPADCGTAKFDPQLSLCRDPDLRKAEAEMGVVYFQLRDRFTGHDRKVFIAGQAYWIAMRSGCPSFTNHRYDGDLLLACLKNKTSQRLTFLHALSADTSLLMSSTGDYTNVDPWYFNEFGKQYTGKEIRLFGWIEGIACDRPPGPARARIADQGVAADVAFSELGQVDVNFLCEKKPGGSWDGVVKLDAEGHPYLYATTIFGSPIP
jgi:uncharacterized protein YecT (DUF1311 family)